MPGVHCVANTILWQDVELTLVRFEAGAKIYVLHALTGFCSIAFVVSSTSAPQA